MSQRFQDLVAFQRSVDLVADLYRVTASFPGEERYGLTSQIRRAGVGVPAQIGEGHGRLTFGEQRQLLSQARGSLFEVEAELIVAQRLGFLPDLEFDRVNVGIQRTGKALVGFIRWVQDREPPQSRRNRVSTVSPKRTR